MAHTLSVDCLRSTYLVPQDHPAPDEVRRELDEVARKYVTDSCGRALSALLDPRDPSVWLIDKVTIDVLMDLHSAAPEDVAEFWAVKMAESVAKTIAHGEDAGRIMHFADRAEYLAYFLRDLAAGAAWSKWYYREFESLRSLPSGAAIREALFREPDLAEPALLHLVRTSRLGEVANLLSQVDQEKLLQLCSPEEATPRKECFEAMLEEWNAAPSRSRRAFYLYLKNRHEHPEFPASEVRCAGRHALTVERWGSSQLRDILTAAAADRLSPVLERLTPQEQETALYLGFLVHEDQTWPGRLAEIVPTRHEQTHTQEAPPQAGEENNAQFTTSFSGAFLLLPTLIANRELMAAFGKPEDGALRYLLLGACLRANSAESQFDQGLAIAAGFAAPPELCVLQQARPGMNLAVHRLDLLSEDLAHIDAAGDSCWPGIALESSVRRELDVAAAVVIRTFARQLPGLGQSSFGYLWRNVLSGDGVITATPGQIVVELAPRPLEIVLRLAGLNEMRFNPPWMAETEVVVRFDRR